MPEISAPRLSTPERAGFRLEAADWRVIAIVFVLMCAVFSLRTVITLGSVPLFAGTDDAMRMVIVRDFLGGQDFLDHLQRRINAPDGAEIHWSRLIDLPLAGLLLLFAPFGPEMAANITGFIWPLGLMGLMLILSAKLTLMLAGREALLAGLILPVLAVPVMSEFTPGRVDHHNVGILLSLGTLIAVLAARDSARFALLAGLLAASALAVAVETLPVVLGAILAFGLGFVVNPIQGRAMRLFGLAFGVASLGHLVLALPPGEWLVPRCDALSSVYVSAALLCGAGFFILSFVADHAGWQGRLIAGLAVGGAIAGVVLVTFPDCVGGPYGSLDPWLARNWLAHIAEALPLHKGLFLVPAWAVGAVVPPFLALVAVAIRLRRPAEDAASREIWARWAVLGLFLFLALAISLVQLRGARLATLFMVPAGAWVIVEARRRYLASGGLKPAMFLVLAWVAFSGVIYLGAVNVYAQRLVPLLAGPNAAAEAVATAGDGQDAEPQLTAMSCLRPAALAPLNAYPGQTLMAPVDLGSHLLMFTGHSVAGAPYHRNEAGMLDSFGFFNRPAEDGFRILDRRGIELVAVCRYLPEMTGFADAAPDSFAAQLKSGVPEGYVRLSAEGELIEIYRRQ